MGYSERIKRFDGKAAEGERCGGGWEVVVASPTAHRWRGASLRRRLGCSHGPCFASGPKRGGWMSWRGLAVSSQRKPRSCPPAELSLQMLNHFSMVGLKPDGAGIGPSSSGPQPGIVFTLGCALG